jgi:uncharacterized protein YggE
MEDKNFQLLNKAFILGAVLVVGVLVFFVGQLFLQNKAISQQNNYQITVSGEGKIYVKPDVAVVNLGVTTDGDTVAEATKSNTEKMNAVIESVKAQGVDEKDIQTTNYSLSPVYETITTPVAYDLKAEIYISSIAPTRTSSKVTGYKISQNIEVKVRNFEKVGDILSKATGSGANQVGDLQFTIDNPEQFREQARASAIEKAKANAQNLAKTSGVKLGKIINVYENYYPVYSSAKGMGGATMDSAVPVVPVIQPGQQEVTVTINLTYQVK